MPDNPISDEDKALFRQMMQTVKPLKPNQPPKHKETQIPPAKTIKASNNSNMDKPIRPLLSNHYFDQVGTDTILSYSKQSIPPKRLTQLKKGQIRWQACLDLHGFRPSAAEDALCHFIDQQQRLMHRSLLIIHGKGSHYGEAPIMKNHVNHWLRQLPNVLAFHSAQARDGGTGAVYVLLQRVRSIET